MNLNMNTKTDVKWWHLNKNAFVSFGNWVKRHPFKACGWTSLFSQLATFYGCNERLTFPWGVAIFVALLLLFQLDLWRDGKKMVALLLACLFLMPVSGNAAEPEPELEPATAYVVIGGVVVVVGGIVVYHIWRFCQRQHQQPPPPPEEEEEGLLPSPGGGASVTLSSLGSCYVPPLTPASASSADPLRTVELSGRLVESANGVEFRVSSLDTAPLTQWVTFEEFQAGWAKHGLIVDDHYTGQVHFAKNGRPSTAEESPFAWDWESRTMTYDPLGQGVTFAVVIERSSDLRTWEPYLSTRMPLGQPVKLSDTALGDRMFYRFRSEP